MSVQSILRTTLLIVMSACLDVGPDSEESNPADLATSIDDLSGDEHQSYLPVIYGISGNSGFYSTGTRIQNPGPSTATVRVRLFVDRATPAAVLRGPIASGASVTLNPLHVLPPGWVVESLVAGVSLQTFGGSATVHANQPVAATVNLVRNCSGQPCAFASYNAIERTTGQQIVPLLLKDTSGTTSWLAIQNANTVATTAEIELRPRPTGTPITVATVSIPPGTTVQARLEEILGIGSTFNGSAIVRSPPDLFGIRLPLAVVANVEKHNELVNVHGMQSSTGFSAESASTQVALPLVMANNSGLSTSILIVNLGLATGTIRVNYSPNQAAGTANACGTPQSKDVSLAPGTAIAYSTAGTEPGFSGCRYVGSARVTSAAGIPILTLVGQAQSGASAISAYEGVNVSDADNTVSLPIIMANNGGFFTGVQIQNVASKAAEVVLKYEPNVFTGLNACAQPPATTRTLPAGASANILQASGFFATCRYIGSATVTGVNTDGSSSSSQLVVLVNEARLSPDAHQDALTTYIGRPNP